MSISLSTSHFTFHIPLSLELELELENGETLNYIVGLINCFTLLLFSLPLIAAGIWMSFAATTDCDNFDQFPTMAAGAFLFIATLIGVIGAWGRVNWFLLLHLVLMFILIVFLLGFAVFAFAITGKHAGAGEIGRIGGREFGSNYSKWIRNRVSNAKNWNRIKKCLIDGKCCKNIAEMNQTYPKRFSEDIELVRLQSGCCKPPEGCQFINSSSSPSTGLRRGNSTTDHQSLNDVDDCNELSNDPKSFCLNCESCKVAVLESLKANWISFANYNMLIVSFLIVIFFLDCYTFLMNRSVNFRVHPTASN